MKKRILLAIKNMPLHLYGEIALISRDTNIKNISVGQHGELCGRKEYIYTETTPTRYKQYPQYNEFRTSDINICIFCNDDEKSKILHDIIRRLIA